MNKIIVTGYSYGYNPVGIRIPFKRGSYYKQLQVSSQYGWEDGCRDRNKRKLKDVVCIEHRPGDAHSVGTAIFVPAEFKCTSKNGNEISTYFEPGNGFWYVLEDVEDCSVPQEHMVSDIRQYI